MKSTVIRSVLAEVYAADKAPGCSELASSSTIFAILRKAVLRRSDSAAEFEKASRPDLAQKEKNEAELLEPFLPPLLSEAEIDRALREVISEQPQLTSDANPRKVMGLVFKSFYTKVDRSSVDADLVRRRAEALLAGA
ncbi:hypothetical protein IEO21_07586 [Rhodonia placenta]|uniref:Altered inheritance of mitochondria protein 41 n=2 Tax=Rhodonia placenta TaxID=104341 RepID=A0A1X6NDM2_9APHY|nr:hypothetical protein POSPLADRAFT_1043997 [Postia placenta MAD-698-R-SB12]KAF9809088.1 hypothetical protein IEO21_07586 [Postia placenta]OSX66620.1 hypothetical protein POSPLADRAFT_1043997 [Postia placenta MAD-698-R-SB12]